MSNLRPGFTAVSALAAAVVAAAFLLHRGGEASFHGTAYDGVPAASFSLTAHDGTSTSLSDFRGRPVLLFFGFAHCPDICPNTLERLDRAVRGAGRRADDTAILLVTIDPERDTPEALRSYLRGFGERVIGLSGQEEVLEEVRRAYGVYVARPSGRAAHQEHHAPVTISHSSAVFGIDRAGILRVVIPYEYPEEWMRDDVRLLARL